jgi:hypothetical protein
MFKRDSSQKNGGNLKKLMLNRHMRAPCQKGENDAAHA